MINVCIYGLKTKKPLYKIKNICTDFFNVFFEKYIRIISYHEQFILTMLLLDVLNILIKINLPIFKEKYPEQRKSPYPKLRV